MDEDSETFDMHVVIEQIGGGPARVVRSIESHPDGQTIVTEYEEVPSGADPYVRSRRRPVGEDPPREIITEFLPSPVRPPTYPEGFPFLEGRECHTTESPAGSMSPGARWPCGDPEVVLASLVEASIANGWVRVTASDIPSYTRDNLGAAFRRGTDLRLFSRLDHEHGSVIQMLDLDERWLDSPYRE